jgi:hypothetical protein
LNGADACAKIGHQMNPFRFRRDKERQRFYLLPGQGGDGYRRKQKLILRWSVIAALFFSAVFSAIIYWLNRAQL